MSHCRKNAPFWCICSESALIDLNLTLKYFFLLTLCFNPCTGLYCCTTCLFDSVQHSCEWMVCFSSILSLSVCHFGFECTFVSMAIFTLYCPGHTFLFSTISAGFLCLFDLDLLDTQLTLSTSHFCGAHSGSLRLTFTPFQPTQQVFSAACPNTQTHKHWASCRLAGLSLCQIVLPLVPLACS